MSSPEWFSQPLPAPCERSRKRAWERQARLTKPPGSLGRLEALAVKMAALQQTETPSPDPAAITVFAADHGIAAEGVSAFPQAVTVEMVKNFASGGAAISVLADAFGARLEVVDVGTVRALAGVEDVVSARAGNGTRNFLHDAAMETAQLNLALAAGRDAVDRARAAGCRLFIGGEMGIGNTTSASALACALLGLSADSLVGPGTGLDQGGISRKCAVVTEALRIHNAAFDYPLEALRRLGGFEIAALVGALLRAPQWRMPVVVDGFIVGVAAQCAVKLRPEVGAWFFYGHRSAEPGHRLVLEALDAEPLLDLGMRLGEGSGGAVALPLLRAACVLHNGMATFEQAGVSKKG